MDAKRVESKSKRRLSAKSLSGKSANTIKLSVKVGVAQEQLEIFIPNDECNPFRIETEIFSGWLQVRIKDYGGQNYHHSKDQYGTVSADQDKSDDYTAKDKGQYPPNFYFKEKKDSHSFSIQIQGSFKKKIACNDIVWSWESLEHIKIPHIFGQFLRVVAPHTMFNFDVPKPYIQSYSVTASSLMQVWPDVKEEFVPIIKEDIASLLPANLKFKASRGLFTSEENHSVNMRRKIFTHEDNRANVYFTPGQTVAFETFNSYIDLNTFKAKIPPGISYDINHVLDGQPFRMLLRTKDNQDIAIMQFCLEKVP